MVISWQAEKVSCGPGWALALFTAEAAGGFLFSIRPRSEFPQAENITAGSNTDKNKISLLTLRLKKKKTTAAGEQGRERRERDRGPRGCLKRDISSLMPSPGGRKKPGISCLSRGNLMGKRHCKPSSYWSAVYALGTPRKKPAFMRYFKSGRDYPAGGSEMSRNAVVKPNHQVGALALWAGSDHYPLGQALRVRDFHLPLNRLSRVYRINFGNRVFGLGQRERYIVAYQSNQRDCMVVLDSLPTELERVETVGLSPLGALQAYVRLLWREPTVLLSLLLIPLPILAVMLLFLGWVNFVLQSPEVLNLFANSACPADCVQKVIKIHSMVGVLFLTPFALVLLPLMLMVFRAPRYRTALNYRFAQTYCAVTFAVAMYFLVQLVVLFPFRGYSRFVAVGFGPQAERFLNDHGLRANDARFSSSGRSTTIRP
jgi:hypothetical protein